MIELGDAAAFSTNYPDQPARLSLRVDSPLLERRRLVELAGGLDPHLVEFNTGTLPLSIAPEDVPAASLSARELIERIGEEKSWMTLRIIEHVADYEALVEEAFVALEEVFTAATSGFLQREAFIFISSAEAVTPFHMDEEHNILIQIEGEKTVMVYPQDDRDLASQADLERFHAGGHRNLELDPDHEGRGQAFQLCPGDALYIPPLAPHWVKVAPGDPALSLSVTWRSKASRRALYLHQINHRLRTKGFHPRFPGTTPFTDQLKIWGASGLARLQKLVGNQTA